MKKEHSAYLDEHPEVRRLLNDFVSQVLVEQPADVFHSAREFFHGSANPIEAPAEEGPEPGDQDDLDDMLADADASSSELRQYLKNMFESMDVDASGELSKAELQAKLSADTELQALLEKAGGDGSHFVLEQLDLDGDGMVSWQEFEAMLGD